jgi:hypothetical protein
VIRWVACNDSARYDADLLGKNEIDDKALVDLWGVVKVSEVTIHGSWNWDGICVKSGRDSTGGWTT